MKKTAIILLLCVLAAPICLGGACAEESPFLGEVRILMYHNVVPDGLPREVYAVGVSQLRDDLRYLRDHGYTVISFRRLIECADSGQPLPDKAVLLTFDDGYLNDMTLGLPVLEEYGCSALMSVVGAYTELGRHNPKVGGNFVYLEWADMARYASSSCVEWGYHSYNLHNYGARKGVARKRGEDVRAYEEMFTADTRALRDKLAEIGIAPQVYAYPYGAYCKESEAILKTMGVRCTLTCEEGVNRVRGADSLYLMKRYNRSGKAESLAQII